VAYQSFPLRCAKIHGLTPLVVHAYANTIRPARAGQGGLEGCPPSLTPVSQLRRGIEKLASAPRRAPLQLTGRLLPSTSSGQAGQLDAARGVRPPEYGLPRANKKATLFKMAFLCVEWSRESVYAKATAGQGGLPAPAQSAPLRTGSPLSSGQVQVLPAWYYIRPAFANACRSASAWHRKQ